MRNVCNNGEMFFLPAPVPEVQMVRTTVIVLLSYTFLILRETRQQTKRSLIVAHQIS